MQATTQIHLSNSDLIKAKQLAQREGLTLNKWINNVTANLLEGLRK